MSATKWLVGYLVVVGWVQLGCTGRSSDDGVGGPSAGASSGGTASRVGEGGDANSDGDPPGGSGPLGGSTAMSGATSAGGQTAGGATSLPVSSDCDPTGTWDVVYSTHPGGGSGTSIPLSPDSVVVTGDRITGLQVDFGRGPSHDSCAGTETGPLGTYSTSATLSGPCLLSLEEASSNVICSETHERRRTIELAIVGDEANGTATDKTGCCNEPARRYDVAATRSP
jgi:hypothetical protein